MIGTLIRHMIYEQCIGIGIAFNRLGSNFATVMPIDRVSRLMKKWGLTPSAEFWESYKNQLHQNMSLGLVRSPRITATRVDGDALIVDVAWEPIHPVDRFNFTYTVGE